MLAVAPSADFHVSIATGIGAAYGYAGAHVEAAYGSVAVFGGLGIGALLISDASWISGEPGGTSGPHLPFALGMRCSMRPEGGFSLAAAGCTMGFTYQDDYRTLTGNRASLTLTAGYRWSFDTLFFELALGGGVAKAVDRGFSNFAGVLTPPRNEVVFQPDGALAVGARF
jgi:hypothetical protein